MSVRFVCLLLSRYALRPSRYMLRAGPVDAEVSSATTRKMTALPPLPPLLPPPLLLLLLLLLLVLLLLPLPLLLLPRVTALLRGCLL